MEPSEIEKLKYPIGKYMRPEVITMDLVHQWIVDIENLPGQLRSLVKELNDQQLNLHYRPGGWTIRQVVHHLPDSHFNSYTRFKLALTENNPTIKPYLENKWAELPDNDADIQFSLLMLDGLHKRWAALLKKITSEQFELTFIHPERKGIQKLNATLGLYAWHGKHHMGHIRQALELKY